MLHYTKHLATLALIALLGILPSMADIVPQTDDPTNSDTYKGWVDNTDGHLTADDITGTTWTGTTLPTARFIYVNEANFPDHYFRALLLRSEENSTTSNINGKGKDGVFTDNEISTISAISCYNETISSLVGISYFTELTYLECSVNRITHLDVSRNIKLKNLFCDTNLLRKLDLNADLVSLSCRSNLLTDLDLSNQTNLTDLSADYQMPFGQLVILSNTSWGVPINESMSANRISDMKITATGLSSKSINCSVSSIDDTNYLYCSTGLSFSDIDKILWSNDLILVQYNYDTNAPNVALTKRKLSAWLRLIPLVACGDNNAGYGNFPDSNFREVVKNFDTNTETIEIRVLDNNINRTFDNITTLESDDKLSKNELQNIIDLYVSNKNIEKLNGIEYMRYLQTLDCSNNKLSVSSDLPLNYPGEYRTFNYDLAYLNCSNNQLTGIDVSKNYLQTLDCSNNKIAQLNLYNNSELVELHCGYNKLTSWTLPSNKTKLVKLTCNDNQLSSLSITDYTALTLLDCSSNKLSTLNVSKNSVLETFNCSNNQLTSLTLPTTKTALLDLNCNTNQLTTSALSTINQYTNLTSLNCGVNKLTTLNLTGNTKLEKLDCASQIDRSLVQLTLPNTTTLADVKCQENSLTEIDFSNNTGLTALDCSTNNLTALDLSANTALETLDYSNQTRTLEAESGLTTADWDAQGNPIKDKFYFFRLDSKSDGSSQPIWSRMTATNYNNATSTFVPGNVFEWTGGGTVVEGTKGKNNAAGVGDVRPQNVVGDILVLTDVTETGNDASGTVTYKYNVNNDNIDPDGSKGDFTLNWITESDVVTEVTDLGAVQREVVAVEYHNLAGMSSDRPWQGVNIVVTRYSDGTVTTRKVLH